MYEVHCFCNGWDVSIEAMLEDEFLALCSWQGREVQPISSKYIVVLDSENRVEFHCYRINR
jgi:hypothetical protein